MRRSIDSINLDFYSGFHTLTAENPAQFLDLDGDVLSAAVQISEASPARVR